MEFIVREKTKERFNDDIVGIISNLYHHKEVYRILLDSNIINPPVLSLHTIQLLVSKIYFRLFTFMIVMSALLCTKNALLRKLWFSKRKRAMCFMMLSYNTHDEDVIAIISGTAVE